MAEWLDYKHDEVLKALALSYPLLSQYNYCQAGIITVGGHELVSCSLHALVFRRDGRSVSIGVKGKIVMQELS